MANKIDYEVGFKVNQAGLKQLKTSLQELQSMKYSDLMKINDSDISSAREALRNIQQDAGQVEQALDKAFNVKLNSINIQTFNKELSKSGLTIQQVYQSFSKAGVAGQAAFRDLSTQLLSTNIQLKESHALLDKMATTLANTIKWNLASGAVNSLSRSVEQAWGYVKSLDTSLNNIRIVTGKSADEMANFAVQANNAAKELGKTTTDYTNASLIYAQQGLNDQEIAARAAITLKAANVTGQSTDEVSEQLTAVWNGYKVTADEAELYVDRLAAIAATTASDLEELSTGMSKVASAAAAMGVGEEQLAAQLSTIISVTKQAPESVGTALRTVYARISDIKAGIDEDGVTLGNYSGKMADLGFNVLDTTGRLRDMGEVMEEIGGRWQDLTREQQISLAQTMAGQRQYSNLIALFDNFEQYIEALNTAQNAAGTLQEQQNIYMESTKAHLATLKASVENIYDSLIDSNAKDGINDLVDGLATAADMVASLVDSLGGGEGVLKTLGAIGFSVFSDQIANSIQITYNNLRRASLQANEFKNAIEIAQKIRDKGLGGDYTQFLAGQQQSVLKIAKQIPTEQFEAFQENFKQLSAVAGNIDRVTAEIDKLTNNINTYGIAADQATNQWKTLDDMLNDSTGIEIITENLNKLEKSFDPIIKKQQQFKEVFKSTINKISTGGNEAQASFEQLKNSMSNFVQSLQTTEGADGKTLFSVLSSGAQQSVNKAQQALNSLDFTKIGNPQQAARQITGIFSQINNTISNEITNIKEAINQTTGNQLEELKKQLAEFEQLQKEIEKRGQELRKKSQETLAFQNITKLASSIGQLGMVIQQVQNLGSIFKNEDLTKGQKALQIITNLTFSFPMLINGIKGVTSALTGLLGITSMGATVGIGAIVTAATAALTYLTYVQRQAAQARKQMIQANQEDIERLKTQQKQLQAQQKLYDQLQKLNLQYKQHEISRYQLKSAIEELIDEYGLQGQAADRLRGSYDSLKDSIVQARKALTQEKLASIEDQIKHQQTAVDLALQDTEGVKVDLSTNQVTYSKNRIGGLDLYNEQSQKLIQELNSINGINANAEGSTLSIGFDRDDMTSAEFVTQITKILEKYRTELADDRVALEQFKRTSAWKSMEAIIDSTSESVKNLTNSFKDQKDILTQISALNVRSIANQSISNVQDYINAKNQLKESLEAEFNKRHLEFNNKQLEQRIDSELSKSSRDLFVKYDALADTIQRLGEKPEDISQNIDKKLSQLTFEQIDYINSLAPSIKDWKTFQIILEKVSGMNFDNVAVLNNDIDALKEEAANRYNKYQSLEEQVRGGKTISPKEFKDLDPEIQGFFRQMANGTYKMTEDAKSFYDTINALKLEGFHNTIEAINRELEKNQSLQNFKTNNPNFDYESLDKSAVSTERRSVAITGQAPVLTEFQSVDFDLVKQQLDYLAVVDDTDQALQDQVDIWKDLLEHNRLGVKQADAIYDAYVRVGDQTQELKDKEQELQSAKAEEYRLLYDAMFPTDEDVNTEALQTLTETISNIAEKSEELANTLSTDARTAEDVAESILRFDDAITDVVDNYDDWIAILNNGSISEQALIMNDLRDAYADLLDLEGSALSQSFLTNAENLELMKAAIDGNTEAYDQLLERAGQDIATQVHLDTTQFQTAFDQLMADYYQGQNLDDMKIGASLDNSQFLEGLSQMVTAAGMTAEQAQAYLASMGVDAEVIEQDSEATENSEAIAYKTNLIPHTETANDTVLTSTGNMLLPVPVTQSVTGWDQEVEAIPVPGTAKKENKSFALKVISAHKSSGGNFKFTQAPNGGGSKGQARRSIPSKGGGGGGKKGGSGGKAAKPDTSKKDLKKELEDERDIYHDINIELEQIDRNLDRAQKKQDRLYGKQLLDNLNEQSRILEQHKQTLKEKQKLQEEDLKQQRKTLKNLGVTFDKYGDISNYMSVLGKKQAEVNALIAEENSMIEAYNKQTDADVKKAIAEQIAEQQKKVKAAQDEYKDLQNKIKNYDETMKGLQDTLDQITEDAQKQVEINIQKFKMEVEIRLDMGQAERDWNKFRRQVLEHTDIIRDTDFHEIFNDALQNANDVTSYFDVHGSKGSIQMLTEQALRTRAQIEQINKTGTSEVYGDNKAQAMEDLQNYLNELMGQMEDVKKLIDDIDKAYLETIDDVEKQFDKQIEDYEFIGELIEHDMDLLSLLYGDKNYDAMNRYYETLEENNLKQLDSLKQQRDFWKQQWDAAMAAGDVQAAKQFEQRYRETIKNLNSLIEDSAKTIQDKYVNAIDKIFDELDKKLTDGKGTDYLNTEWELMNKNADEYLDTINSAFAIQETERKYQQALNDTKSIKNQQALKNLMDEQLDILKNKEKITQYDIDRAEKLLQVEQARIALEDAQSAKTSMRLKRDSQGNYSYEFAADEGAIGDAQANLAAAQNDLYNFDKDAYKKNLDDMLSAYQDFVERSKQLSLAAAQGDAEAQEKLVLLREQFGEYINGKTEQNLTIRTNLTDSALKDLALLYDKNVENYQNMSDGEKKILMEDLIPAWDGGIQKMIDKVAGEGGFIPTIEQSFNKVDKATKDYQQELDGLADAAGISLGDVKDGVDLLANAFGVLVQANDDLVERMEKELTAVQMLREQAQGLVSAYGAVYAAAAQAVTELHNFVQAEQGAAAAYAQTAAAYENMVHRIQQANADYAAHPYGGGYTPPSGNGNNDSGGGTDNNGSGTDNSGNGTDNSGDQDLLKKNRRGNRGCFAAGTKIIMADQLVKNIEDIQVGDLVIAYNDETCTYEPRKVTKTFIHQNMPELVNIILSNGIILKITPGHPILTTEGWKSLDIENSWYEHGVQATLLKINDEILGYNGNTFVSGIHYLPFSNYTVYNLEVETCHTFLADGIVVHNVKVNDPIRLATGGYTGNWSSSEGKIAILHEKEQVFNEDDTQKLLEAVQILREITFNSNVSLKNRMSQLSVRSMVATSSSSSAEELQQTVSISATFPNVNSKREIEEALNDLVNLAAQRRMRRG